MLYSILFYLLTLPILKSLFLNLRAEENIHTYISLSNLMASLKHAII